MKTQSILFRVSINGNGVVNYDSKEQKWVWNEYRPAEKEFHDNTIFAKKRWYKNDEDGKVDTRLIISSGCLKHEIFIKEIPFQSPNIMNNEHLLLNMLASPESLLRGYLFANKGKPTLKRSSAITLTDAEQTCGAISTLETFSKSGEKNIDENKSDNTFFKKETVGKIQYEAFGAIDLMQLQFISTDEVFDRLGVNPDLFPTYKEILSSRMKIDSELGYYKIKNSVVDLPEYGFMFSNENIVFLTKLFFKKLLSVNIRKSNSYANVVSLEYKMVYDPLIDTLESEDNWKKMTATDLDNFDFETNEFYEFVDSDFAKKQREEIERMKEEIKVKNKAEKEELAKSKKAKKTTETTETTE